MKRIVFIAATCVIAGALAFAADKAKDIWSFKSPKAKGAKVRYDNDVKMANAAYEAKVKRLQAERDGQLKVAQNNLLKALDEAMKAAMKVDNLDEAVMIRQAKKAVEEGQDVPVPLANADANAFLGKNAWRVMCWSIPQRRWIMYPMEKMKTSSSAGAFKAVNTTGIGTSALLTYARTPLLGDFNLSAQIKGGSAGLRYMDGTDRGTWPMNVDKNLYKSGYRLSIIRRQGKLTWRINGKTASLGWSNNDVRNEADDFFLTISVARNATVEVRNFRVELLE